MPVTVGGSPITQTQADQLLAAMGLDPAPVTTVKPTPVGADRVVLLDSAAGFAPVLATLATLPGGGGAGALVTVTHNGGGANPVAGNTVTAAFAAGYSGTVQWTRNGANIAGATSTTYLLTGADSGTTVAAVVTSLVFTATGLPVGAAATAPAAMTAGQWTAEATVTPGEIGINIVTLPSNGGSAITALEYRVGAGAAIALTGTGTGLRTVTAGFSAGVAVDIQVRAVNAIGAGAWSDIKNRTPAAAPSGVTFVAAGAPYNTISSLTAHSIPVPAGLAVGDLLVVTIGDFADATSISTNTAQNFTRQVRQVGAIWSLVISGSVPTSITVNYGTASDLSAQAIAFRGATTLAGTPINEEVFSARATIPYVTDNASAAVVCVYVRNHPQNATAAQFNGADAADLLYKVEFTSVGWFAGIHDGPTGSNTIGMTWSATDTGGRYLVAAFRP
jgi:hypothetical protein